MNVNGTGIATRLVHAFSWYHSIEEWENNDRHINFYRFRLECSCECNGQSIVAACNDDKVD